MNLSIYGAAKWIWKGCSKSLNFATAGHIFLEHFPNWNFLPWAEIYLCDHQERSPQRPSEVLLLLILRALIANTFIIPLLGLVHYWRVPFTRIYFTSLLLDYHGWSAFNIICFMVIGLLHLTMLAHAIAEISLNTFSIVFHLYFYIFAFTEFK